MKRKIKRLLKRIISWFKKPTDPLSILREETYADEEINEMTGRMIREQYKQNN